MSTMREPEWAGARERARLAIADDHAIFRQALKTMLRLQPEMAVVAEMARADDLLPCVERSRADVLLLDLRMDRNVFVDIEELAKRVLVVVVTATEEVEEAVEAVRAGARGIVFKRLAYETLITAIETVLSGQVWLPPSLQSEIVMQLWQRKRARLTTREQEIARQVALGKRNNEIADRLQISEVTVKTHLTNILQKVGVRDRVELTLYAIHMGMIRPSEYPPLRPQRN